MKASELKVGDRIIFDNGSESQREIVVSQKLLDNYKDGEEMHPFYKPVKPLPTFTVSTEVADAALYNNLPEIIGEAKRKANNKNKGDEEQKAL